MNAGALFGRVAAWAARHARPLVAVTAVLAVAAAVGATRLPTDAGVDTLADPGSATVEATERVREDFGEEPIVVLVKGELPELLLTDDLFRLLRLEGCLSSKVPKGAEPIPGPCAELAQSGAVEFLTGPGTFLNESVVQIDNQLQKLAENVPADRFREYLLAVATRYGITSVPSITNEEFVATVVFDFARPRGTPKARLAYLFPNARSAQIVIRLRPDLSEAERHRAIELIEAAVEETTPRKACKDGGKPAPCFELEHGSYVVSGAPVVIDGVSRALKSALLVLFAAALAVMALVLLLVFRSRRRLLPLLVALILGKIERTGSIAWVMPVSANLTLRQIGLLLFLAGIGTKAGFAFVQTMRSNGVQLLVAGAVLTFSVTLVALVVGYKLLNIPLDSLLGFMSGLQTQPACLAFASNLTKSENTYIAYAGIYPAAMIAKIILAQLLA